MPRRRSATLQFNAIQLVGGLLPASLLEQIALQQAHSQKASDYGLPRNQRLQVAVDQAWSAAKALWQEAQELRRRGDGSGADTPWASWFSQRLLRQVFGWDDLTPCPPRQREASLYPISHQAFAGAVPLLLTSLANDELDKGHRQYGQDGRKRSPHSCLQECLNADDNSNWGLLCNGTSLRLLHDNPALVKPAYVHVALDQLFEGGLFDEFAVVWLLLHASRFSRDSEGRCVLDAWKQAGQQSGERALTKLRDGVQAALEAVGQGMLLHPANHELVAQLQSGAVADLMVPAPELEPLEPTAPLPEVITHLTQGSASRGSLGATWVHNGSGDLAGLITDGDLRRTLQRHGPQEWPVITAAQMATPHPITVPPEMLAAEALALMEHNPRQAISVLPVVDPAQPLRLLGLLRLHDLVQAGFTSSAGVSGASAS